MSTTTDREQVRTTLATLAQKASAALPTESAGRLAAAVQLVLAGDVTLADDGTALVGSATDPTTVYRVNGLCPCSDFPRAPATWCKHRIARALAIRLQRTMEQTPPTPAAPAVSLPEAPASANCHITIAGRQVQLTLRDTDEVRLLARLEEVLQRFPLPPGQGATQGQEPSKGWCRKHNVQMKQTEKNGRTWWSHRTTDGWCTGR